MAVIVGVDVGYGALKVAFGAADAVPKVLRSPARAAPVGEVAEHIAPEHGSGLGNPLTVVMEGERWAVGFTADQLDDGQRPPLHEDYASTQPYRALYLAALHLADAHRIDTLVSGLPVTAAVDAGRRDRLRQQLRGRFTPNGAPIQVHDVRVLAQPVGSYVAMLAEANEEASTLLCESTVLVLDVGHYSVDWSLIARGHLHQAVSGTSLQATSLLIEDAARRIAEEQGGSPPTTAIESALQRGLTHIYYRGTRVDLMAYLHPAADRRAATALDQMRQALRHGNLHPDVVLLTGGGADYYRSAVCAVYDGLPCLIPDEPALANARGYFHYGAHQHR